MWSVPLSGLISQLHDTDVIIFEKNRISLRANCHSILRMRQSYSAEK